MIKTLSLFFMASALTLNTIGAEVINVQAISTTPEIIDSIWDLEGQTIALESDETITLNNAEPLLIKNGTIEANSLRAVYATGADVTFEGINFINTSEDMLSEIIRTKASGTITLDGCNISARNGYAISKVGSETLDIKNSTINSEFGIYASKGDLKADCDISSEGNCISTANKPSIEITGGSYISTLLEPIDVKKANLSIYDGLFFGKYGKQDDLLPYVVGSCRGFDDSGLLVSKHNPLVVIERLEPTCETDGYTAEITCENCGTTLESSEPLQPLGHDLVDGICQRCDYVEEQRPEDEESPTEEEPQPGDDLPQEGDDELPPVIEDSPVLEEDEQPPKVEQSSPEAPKDEKPQSDVNNNGPSPSNDVPTRPEEEQQEIEAFTYIPFKDVEADSWFTEAISYVSSMGYMNGYDEDTFGPNNFLTRGEAAQILWNMNRRVDSVALPAFEDVGPWDFYYKAVGYCFEKGLLTGYDAARFGGSDSLTREQLATILWRVENRPEVEADLSSFKDQDEISLFAEKAMRWATSVGLIRGRAEDRLAPQENMTRAEIAVVLWRTKNI